MNIVVISKRKNLLFFGTNEVPKGVMGLKIDFVRGKQKTNYEPFEINTIEDFQEACVTEKAKSKKTINGFLSSGDYRENQVFIVPEGWEEGSIDKGYEMACELLNSVGQIKPFNLRFVSMHTREQLLRMVKKENKTLVETFPHYCFFDDQVTLIPEAYSTAHFRLIKDIAVSDSGRLSLIKHEVKNIVEEKLDDQHLSEATARFKRHALKILDDLDCPAYTNCYSDCKRELVDLQQKVHGITASTSIDELKGISSKVQNDILQLIQDINIRLPRVNPQESLPNAKKNYRVLIIEDNLDQRTSLYHFFNKHYEFVCCNDLRETIDDIEYGQWKRQLETTYCGADVGKIKAVEDAINTITLKDFGTAKTWINNIKDVFDVVILDLLFKGKDNETWLPFNGLDLLCSVRKNIPYSTVRIITSLPRHEVGSILEEEGIVVPMNQIFTKGNGWPQLEGCLYDRLDEINTECKENESRRRAVEDICMPEKGIFFPHSEVREHVQRLILNKKFQSVFEKALTLIDCGPLELMGKHSFDKKKVEQVFVNFLAHRLAFILWAAKNGVFSNIDVSSYTTNLKAPNPKKGNQIEITKEYLNRIGFSTTISENKTRVNLSLKEMFPEEYEFYLEKLNTNACPLSGNSSIFRWYLFIFSTFSSRKITKIKMPKINELSNEKLNKFLSDCFDRLEISIDSAEKGKLLGFIEEITKEDNLKKALVKTQSLKEELRTALSADNKRRINNIRCGFIPS